MDDETKKRTVPSGTKMNVLRFLTGVLWGVALTVFCGVLFLRGELISEQECAASYEEAVKLFPQRVLAQKGWTVRTVPCGLPIQEPGKRITVFELCSREYAGRILRGEADRKTAAVLPCKIAIYERGGKVYLARLNAGVFMRLLGGAPAEVFERDILPEQRKMLSGLLIKP